MVLETSPPPPPGPPLMGPGVCECSPAVVETFKFAEVETLTTWEKETAEAGDIATLFKK